jgi:acetylornithine deacetylase
MTPGAQSAVAILDKLVGFDTVSKNSNLALIEWIRDYCREHGVTPVVIPSPDGGKANLFATIGPLDQPALLLSGHTDVVPVDGQAWSRDPFRLSEVDGRLYGRGTCDMKGFLACILALIPRARQAKLRRPIHLAFSYDEELGCFGAPGIIRHIEESGLKPGVALIGEPSRMQVVNGHKGSCGMLTQVTGLGRHSSRPDLGVNAAFYGADIIAFLRQRATALAAAPDSVGVFEPPYTTVSVGVVHAGAMRNAVAADCRIEWDIRATRPGMVEMIQSETQAYIDSAILPDMRSRASGADVVNETVYDVPLLMPESNGEAERIASALLSATSASTVAYGSEAGMFQRAGMSTVICGPGDILQAHTPDEWIEISEIEACAAFLDRLVGHASGH